MLVHCQLTYSSYSSPNEIFTTCKCDAIYISFIIVFLYVYYHIRQLYKTQSNPCSFSVQYTSIYKIQYVSVFRCTFKLLYRTLLGSMRNCPKLLGMYILQVQIQYNEWSKEWHLSNTQYYTVLQSFTRVCKCATCFAHYTLVHNIVTNICHSFHVEERSKWATKFLKVIRYYLASCSR